MTRYVSRWHIFKTELKYLGKIFDSLQSNYIKNFGDIFSPTADNEFHQNLKKWGWIFVSSF